MKACCFFTYDLNLTIIRPRAIPYPSPMFVYRRLEEERQNQLRYNRMKMKQYDRVSCAAFQSLNYQLINERISYHWSLSIPP